MDLSLRKETDVCVHTAIGSGHRFHVRRPAEARLVDDPLDSGVSGSHGIYANAADLSSVGAGDRSQE
jgi:hypothetical protein